MREKSHETQTIESGGNRTVRWVQNGESLVSVSMSEQQPPMDVILTATIDQIASPPVINSDVSTTFDPAVASPYQLRHDVSATTADLGTAEVGEFSTEFFVGSESSSVPGGIEKAVLCPVTGEVLLPTGSQLEISDFVVSASARVGVTLRFDPPGVTIMRAMLNANETVVTNFTGLVRSTDQQAVKIDCGLPATVTVTFLGSKSF